MIWVPNINLEITARQEVLVDLFLLNPEFTDGKYKSIWNIYSEHKTWNSRTERHVDLEFILSKNTCPIWKLYSHPGIRAWRIQVHLEPPFSAWNSRAENKDPCRTSPWNLRAETQVHLELFKLAWNPQDDTTDLTESLFSTWK